MTYPTITYSELASEQYVLDIIHTAKHEELRRLGHSVDKVEFIVMGGTFMSLDSD